MRSFVLCLALGLFLGACSSAPPKPNVAQKKTVEVDGTVLEFGGEYWVKKNNLILFVNGDPVMRGSFPPLTPTLNLKTKYNGLDISSFCYFGSVLSREKGVIGLVAGAVQSRKGKSGDRCEVKISGEIVEHLYF